MAVKTKKTFPNAVGVNGQSSTVFTPVEVQLNNQDDLDVYVTVSGGTRVLQLRQSTTSTAVGSGVNKHPQVNDTTGLYFPAVTAGTTLYNYTLSTDNNTITFSTALPSGAVVSIERRTRDADSNYTTFASGSTIRATDLNNSSTESNFTAQEARNKAFELEGRLFDGEAKSSGFITSADIIDGSILDQDINANAEIAVSKLADGAPYQLLHTAANGTDVEWTNNVDIPGTLDVTGNTILDANLTVANNVTVANNFSVAGTSTVTQAATFGNTVDISNQTTINAHLDVNGSASIDDISIGSAADNIITTTSGNLELDSASGTTRVDDDLVVTGSITAPLWNGNLIDSFWLTNKQTIDHVGETITLGKSSTNNIVSNATHKFSVAKDYTFEVGKYVNEGVAGGAFNTHYITPVLQVQHLIDYDSVSKIGGSYSTSSNAEFGSINLGTGSYSGGSGLDSTLSTTEIKHSHLVFSARKGHPTGGGSYTNNTGPNDPNGFQPVLVLSGQKGAMFTHPDNTSYTYTVGSTSSGLPLLAKGAYRHGVRTLGDPYNWGDSGYKTSSEACALLEAAIDFQIILGGARAKNRFEIGSSSVAGVLSLNGTDVTATASELSILNGVTADNTEINKLDGFTGSTQDLEEVVTGKTVEEQISGSSTNTQLPTALAVNTRIIQLMTDVGGFHPIADEVSFPTTNVDINDGYGTIISIADAGGLKVADGSGSGTYAGTAGNSIGATTTAGTAVTITGIDSSLHGTTIGAGKGMLVETTTTLNEYAYHRLVLDESGVSNADSLVSAFNEKYYGPHAANQATRPSGANRQNGDLYFNTSDGKMKVFNGSHATGTWDDVAAPGNFFINTLSSSGSSTDTPPGGSAIFNGTARKFTLSNPPLTAQQLLVSVNGVIQKPNSGTSPSEGFAINGADIIFASAPATNAPFFIVTIGSSVNIGTPSDGTVTTVKLDGGAVTDAKVSSTAGILGTKISPNFGGQNVQTSGSITVDGSTADTIIKNTGIEIEFTRPGVNYINASNASGSLELYTANSSRLTIASDGTVGISGNLDVGNGIDVTGTISSTGIATFNNTINLNHASAGSNIIYFNEDLQFAKNGHGTELVIDTSGRLGIGVTSPSGVIHAYQATGTQRSYFESGDEHSFLRVLAGTSGKNSGIEFYSGSSANIANITALNTTALQFDVGTVNGAMYIDSSGHVGINCTPSRHLHVHSGTSDIVALFESGDTSAQIQIKDSTGTSTIECLNDFRFLNSTHELVRFKSDKDVQIMDGNLIVASGHGIEFVGTGTGTSTLLDDYEEGTWSPALAVSSGSYTTTPTLTVSNARYTKIGRQVFCEAYIQFSSNGAGGSGYQILTGLPYTVNSAQTYSGVYYGWHDLNDALMNEHETLTGYVQNGNTYLVFYKSNTNGANSTLDAPTMTHGQSGNFQINFHYTIA